MNTEGEFPTGGPGAATFATTHWSVVFRAGDRAAGASEAEAKAALGKLYRTYSYPLYSYLRRQGQSPEVARDVVHDLFLDLLEKDRLATVSPEKGRFRSYLLAAANHRLANEWTRSRRQKRGGGQIPVALDALTVEERYRLEPADPRTPETLYERRWALALLEEVHSRLRQEWKAAGKERVFGILQVFLSGDHEAPSYAEVGREAGLSEGTARVAVHRLRQRYRDLLRSAIGQTVESPGEVDDELRHLLAALRG